MSDEKYIGKGLLWYIENNKTIIEPLRILLVEESIHRILESRYPYQPPTDPKIPKRVPKRKK